MEAIITAKKEFASLAIYRKKGDEYEFFMQKRGMNAARSPGLYGIFGGTIEEGETPEETLVREIREELEYETENPKYFSRYESANGIVHVFLQEVGTGFESRVVVHEGEFGKFFTAGEVAELKTGHIAGIAVREVNEWLLKTQK